MSSHEHTVLVDRPVRTVYDQWTQFETYPAFLDEVTLVQQIDPATTHWRVRIAGVEREYDAAIVEQRPDEVIAWQTVDGPTQAGMVRFASVTPDQTRVTLRMEFTPHGVVEKVGETTGVVARHVETSLENFKAFMEQRGSATGGWRGEIHDGVPVDRS